MGSQELIEKEGTSEAIVLVKAAPHSSKKYGETVCCAAVTDSRQWVRIYPVQFRHLDEAQKFSRWDRIKFNWRRPTDDYRAESRRVSHDKLKVIGSLPLPRRVDFLAPIIVTSLDDELSSGRTMALLRPREVKFKIYKKTNIQLHKETNKIKEIRSQSDLFSTDMPVERKPCPYQFKFLYSTDDGKRTSTCGDWETEAMFYNFRNQMGEENALKKIAETFGEDYPKKGMVFAMGTHSLRPKQWLLVGVIRLDKTDQFSLGI